MKTNMHFGASNRIFSNAKSLRAKLTFAEKLLWSRIRNKKLGYHFRRQHPASDYVVDFFCLKLNLVIEVDGGIHLNKTVRKEDESKEKSLISYDLTVIRFTNDEAIKYIDAVIAVIIKTITLIEHKRSLSGDLGI